MRKKLFVVLAAVGMFALLLMLARFYILSRIKDKLEQQLFALKDSGYVVKYDSILVNTKKK